MLFYAASSLATAAEQNRRAPLRVRKLGPDVKLVIRQVEDVAVLHGGHVLPPPAREANSSAD
jgi:hypothetical protein